MRLKRLAWLWFPPVVLALSAVLWGADALAVNETVTLEGWAPSWRSNDPSAGVTGGGVVSYDPVFNRRSTYPTVKDYVEGVLNKECLPGDWGNDGRYLSGYKAVGVAARNVLLNKHKKYEGLAPPLLGVPYDVLNSVSDQTDEINDRDLFSNHRDAISDPLADAVASYPVDWETGTEPYTYTAFFSSISPDSRVATYNSEESRPSTPGGAIPFSYRPYMRNALQESYSDVPGGRAGGHGAGMSQFGAMHYSATGWTFQQILEHYYHAAPPYVKKLIIKQGTTIVHRKEWEDQFNAPFNPLLGRREKPGGVSLPVNGSQDLSVEVYYSEDVSNTFPVTMQIEGCASGGNPPWLHVDLTFRTIQTVGGTTYYNRALGTIDKSKISSNCLGAGAHQIRLQGRHKYVAGWQLDSNPVTVSFDGSEGSGRYELGTDLKHQLMVSTVPPQKPTNFQGRAGDGRAKFMWTAPTENADHSRLTDLDGCNLYYSTDCVDPTGPSVFERSEARELSMANDASYCACVTAVDTLGNESEPLATILGLAS